VHLLRVYCCAPDKGKRDGLEAAVRAWAGAVGAPWQRVKEEEEEEGAGGDAGAQHAQQQGHCTQHAAEHGRSPERDAQGGPGGGVADEVAVIQVVTPLPKRARQHE
jgi:hypothetical protein